MITPVNKKCHYQRSEDISKMTNSLPWNISLGVGRGIGDILGRISEGSRGGYQCSICTEGGGRGPMSLGAGGHLQRMNETTRGELMVPPLQNSVPFTDCGFRFDLLSVVILACAGSVK